MAGTIEQDAPRARLAALLQHFSDLDDSREPWRVMYPLKEVLLLVTCATIASCDDFDEIADWGEHNIDFLRRFSDYHHGIPCERWLRSLFNRVDPTLFARCFENWVAAQWPGRHEFIAIDGKTARRSHDRRKGLKALVWGVWCQGESGCTVESFCHVTRSHLRQWLTLARLR